MKKTTGFESKLFFQFSRLSLLFEIPANVQRDFLKWLVDVVIVIVVAIVVIVIVVAIVVLVIVDVVAVVVLVIVDVVHHVDIIGGSIFETSPIPGGLWYTRVFASSCCCCCC